MDHEEHEGHEVERPTVVGHHTPVPDTLCPGRKDHQGTKNTKEGFLVSWSSLCLGVFVVKSRRGAWPLHALHVLHGGNRKPRWTIKSRKVMKRETLPREG